MWLVNCSKNGMRRFLPVLIIAGLGLVYLWQKQNEASSPTPKPNQTQTATARARPSTPQLTPAPRGQASEHNWMKRSLDRAATVRDQARSQTKESQDPDR